MKEKVVRLWNFIELKPAIYFCSLMPLRKTRNLVKAGDKDIYWEHKSERIIKKKENISICLFLCDS